jgi:hypothetical protein
MNIVESVPGAIENAAQNLGVESDWVQKGGVYWFTSQQMDVRELATAMNAIHARFVTITATELPGNDGFRLEYLWDLGGKLLGFTFHISGNSIDSIYDLCEAVDWIEREVHEGFAIDFLGREYEPLLLRPGDKLGVNLREVAK